MKTLRQELKDVGNMVGLHAHATAQQQQQRRRRQQQQQQRQQQ
jgi:hypothetical protein